ncbi:MAG: Na(+)-translocating NADH-quinone reductase subunit A [Acidiferrobacterales bacterium]|nr:Na(+)-translocating NADH-quinone reductase subunit A [Acidiferrobacterales bacterium]
MHFKLKKGLEIPLRGRPDQRVETVADATSVAVLGSDYIGLKPTMLVSEGDTVKLGTPLFEDKKNPGIFVTAPASGKVAEINRGAKRALVSVVIDIEGEEAEEFTSVGDVTELNAEQIRTTLLKSGLWTAFRTRPYGKVPAADAVPSSIFVNAMDTNPLALDPTLIINENASKFATGISVLAKFDLPVYVCQEQSAKLPEVGSSLVKAAYFSGPHPAGLSSTHVHYLDPVNASKQVWCIGYQDVIAIGQLFLNGRMDATRYVAVAGPYVNSPRVFTTRLGAKVSELVQGRTSEGITRVISGSVLNGHNAAGDQDYLGRYDTQISVIEENDDREFMGWIAPGTAKFSALNVFISSILKPKAYNITSSQNGSPRAVVPIGVYEKVMPLDILPTPLLKSILVKDTDSAQELGCLELVEEDLALCSFVDPGKHDFGPALRTTLTQIEREG